MASHLTANVERFSGFADCYDQFRPQLSVIIPEILVQLAGGGLPRLVVDLGSGTGLSTRIWVGRTQEVVGIEPNSDMRRMAEQQTTSPADDTRISYREGISTQTGLADGCADIVCCSQSFHWMEPGPTLCEVARILRPGGVFATIDNDWPPTVQCEVEQAYQALMQRARALETAYGVYDSVTHWPKNEHLANITRSGLFRYTKEFATHNVETGNAERLVGLAMSMGSVEGLLKMGVSEEEIGLPALHETASRILGDTLMPWYFSYRVRIGVK